MKTELCCPLCEEKVYSDVGKGCLMCGMPLEKPNEEFCSGKCEKIFSEINNF